MTATTSPAPRRGVRGLLDRVTAPGRLGLLQAASMLLAAGAQAQTPACDSLKSALAQRIESAGVRGYSLEAVPASTPVPPGARVIGTCDGGATRILYRRWDAARASSDAASDAGPSIAPRTAARASEPAPSPVRSERASQPVAAAAPRPAPQPGPALQASAPPVPVPASRASDVEVARASDRTGVQPVKVASDEPVATPAPQGGQAFGFISRYWPWILAVLGLPLAGWLWAWRAHRNAYDEAGLPRGPRL